MKLSHKIKFFLPVALVSLIFGVAVIGSSSAYAEDGSTETPDIRLQISPVERDLGELQPGETYTSSVKVQNTGLKTLEFKVEATPYSVTDEKYSLDFEKSTDYNQIVNWISFSQTSGSVESGKEVEVRFTVKVPKDAPKGGQYAAIMVSTDQNTNSSGLQSGDESSSVGIKSISRAALPVISYVAGDTRREGKILENNVPMFLFNPPISATTLVENTGNVHTDAESFIQVFPVFSSEEVYTNEENPSKNIILPESKRLITETWTDAPQLGLFRVKQTVKFLDQTSINEKIVFICPMWFLFIIISLIFFVVFWIVSRARARKKTAKAEK